jgi:hypothetical protein
VSDIRATQLDSLNLPLLPINIWEVLDDAALDKSNINLRNLLPNRGDEGTLDNVPASSQLV